MQHLPALKTNRGDVTVGKGGLEVLPTLFSNVSPCRDEYDRGDCERVRDCLPQAKEFIARGGLAKIANELCKAEQPATKQQIGKALGMLVAAFPNAPKSDLAGYGAALSQHVRSKSPSIYALETACWKLREACRYPPAISEVLEAVAAAERELDHRRWLIAEFPNQVAACEKALIAYDAARETVTKIGLATLARP